MTLPLPLLLSPLRALRRLRREAQAQVRATVARPRPLIRLPAVPAVELVEDPSPEILDDPSPPAVADVSPPAAPAPEVEILPGVELGPRQRAWLALLRAELPADLPLTVTSGRRSAQAQARAMAAKLARGEDLLALYVRDDLVAEIIAAAGPDRQHPDAWAMGLAIEDQAARGQAISRHLLPDDALDLRSRHYSRPQRDLVVATVRRLGAECVVEPDHLHVEDLPSPLPSPTPE